MQTVTALVIKHNRLIEACYDLNINEQKLLIYAISKIDTNNDKFNIINIVVKDFVGLFDTVDERHTEIRNLAKSLKRRELLIQTERGELLTNWFSSIEYIKNEAIVEVEFSSKLIPYLLHIRDMYTQYNIKNIIHMKCKYSIRMYELLKQYEKIGKRAFTIPVLKRILGCPDKFSRFSDFDRRVLKPSLKEINALTDIKVISPKKIKKGREIVKVEFVITKKKVNNETLDMYYTSEEVEDIKKQSDLMSNVMGKILSDTQIIELYELACEKTINAKYDISPFDYIRLNLNYVKNQNGVIHKYAYLKKAIADDFANASTTLYLNAIGL